MKRFRAALKNKSNWPSLVTLALILACSLFSFWDTRFSEQARSAAFALVAVEFFIMLVVHLEEVKDSRTESMRLRKWEISSTGQIIAEAEKELFFSGWTLIGRIAPYQEELLAMESNIRIRMLIANLNNEAVHSGIKNTFGRSPKLKSLDYFNCFAAKQNIEIRTVNFPMAMFINARDIHTRNGRLTVAYQDFGEDDYDSPLIELTRTEADWYDHYKSQIELLWAQGTPWPPPTKEGTP